MPLELAATPHTRGEAMGTSRGSGKD
jgi:hypothetical protein